jgi:undecaprenyl-diphosphatase
VILLGLVVVTAIFGGAAAALASRAWPAADPASPRLTTKIARWELRKHPGFVRARFDPGVATGLALTLAVVLVVVGIGALTLTAVMVATATGVELADRPIEEWANEHASPFAIDVLETVTDLGATVPVIVLVIVVGMWEHVRLPNRALFPFLLVAVGGQSLVTNALKAIADRARPDINPVAENLGPSFPSGHTATAAAALAALALVLGRRRSRRVQLALVGAAVGLAAAVAATRVLLGVHFLTDVIAGLGVGWAWFALTAIAFGGRLLHFGAPVEVAERAAELAPHPEATPRERAP